MDVTIIANLYSLDLEVARVVALEKMRELSSLYTKPVENDMLSPCHRYTLRGVATDTNVTYVLKNPIRPHDLIDTYDVEWQWWKIRFVSGNTSPITYTVRIPFQNISTLRNHTLVLYMIENMPMGSCVLHSLIEIDVHAYSLHSIYRKLVKMRYLRQPGMSHRELSLCTRMIRR